MPARGRTQARAQGKAMPCAPSPRSRKFLVDLRKTALPPSWENFSPWAVEAERARCPTWTHTRRPGSTATSPARVQPSRAPSAAEGQGDHLADLPWPQLRSRHSGSITGAASGHSRPWRPPGRPEGQEAAARPGQRPGPLSAPPALAWPPARTQRPISAACGSFRPLEAAEDTRGRPPCPATGAERRRLLPRISGTA